MSSVCHHLALPQFVTSSKPFSIVSLSSISPAKCSLNCSAAPSCSQKRQERALLSNKGRKVHLQTCSTPFLVSTFSLEGSDGDKRKWKKGAYRGAGVAQAYFNGGGSPGGGGGGGNRQQDAVIRNLVGAGVLVVLTYTGVLRVVFDIIASLWILFMLLVLGVIGSYAAFSWWAEGKLVTGTCPSCGQEFKALSESPLNQPQRCLYCATPFEVLDKKFVRVEPKFSPDPFAGFGFKQNQKKQGSSSSSKNWKSDAAGSIVDIEAEVMDKD